MKKWQNYASVLAIMMSVSLLLAGCGQAGDGEPNEQPNEGQQEETAGNNEEEEQSVESIINEGEQAVVTMEMENGGEVVIELYHDVAPITVDNFVSLVDDGFYDGLTFHRVIPGFMVQGGDPEGTGIGGPGYSIEGEFSDNGFENNLKHERGVISMARSAEPNSAGSQFFIMVDDVSDLDGAYAAFGQVIEGMDVVDDIVAVETGSMDKPVEGQEQVISKMTVEIE